MHCHPYARLHSAPEPSQHPICLEAVLAGSEARTTVAEFLWYLPTRIGSLWLWLADQLRLLSLQQDPLT